MLNDRCNPYRVFGNPCRRRHDHHEKCFGFGVSPGCAAGRRVAVFASAQSPWKENGTRVARGGGRSQVTLYGCCYDYDRVVEDSKKYPKSKSLLCWASGNQLATRMLADGAAKNIC